MPSLDHDYFNSLLNEEFGDVKDLLRGRIFELLEEAKSPNDRGLIAYRVICLLESVRTAVVNVPLRGMQSDNSENVEENLSRVLDPDQIKAWRRTLSTPDPEMSTVADIASELKKFLNVTSEYIAVEIELFSGRKIGQVTVNNFLNGSTRNPALETRVAFIRWCLLKLGQIEENQKNL